MNALQEVKEYQVRIPSGVDGQWKVEHKTISKAESNRCQFFAALKGSGRYTGAGTFTGLLRNGHLVMSDTPDERYDHIEPVRNAHGHCLVNGLGIGFVAGCMLDHEEVEKVTVIELSASVIRLIGPSMEERYGKRIEIIEDSAFCYQPPRGIRYGTVWHDIWDSICGDNLPGMRTLHRRYGRRCDWQGSWARELCY